MRSKHGATWWSARFLRSLERLGMTTRLKRGHKYFLEGRVLELCVEPGEVRSNVRGQEDYDCQIYFEPFSDMEWNESLDRLAFGDLSAAALLTTGRMPPQIENFFAPSGRRLLPQASGDLELHCSCPDTANPCKHLAATAYVLAERLDRDPYLLFLLRGRSAAQVEDALRERWDRDLSEDVARAESDIADSAELKPEENVDLFWANEMEGPLLFVPRETSAMKLTIERMSVPEPKIDEKFWRKTLEGLYEGVAERAGELLD
jgi:uncharacterized Zn finger protein